jgi:hypothetical protein
LGERIGLGDFNPFRPKALGRVIPLYFIPFLVVFFCVFYANSSFLRPLLFYILFASSFFSISAMVESESVENKKKKDSRRKILYKPLVYTMEI